MISRSSERKIYFAEENVFFSSTLTMYDMCVCIKPPLFNSFSRKAKVGKKENVKVSGA